MNATIERIADQMIYEGDTTRLTTSYCNNVHVGPSKPYNVVWKVKKIEPAPRGPIQHDQCVIESVLGTWEVLRENLYLVRRKH